MVLQDLLAGGVEYVQDSQPSNADAGEIWLDTSVDPSALKIYDASSDVWDEAQASNLDAPVSNIQDELQSGRTRELLLLLQDKPVPEVQDPLIVQTSLSADYTTDVGGDYKITDNILVADFEDSSVVPTNPNWDNNTNLQETNATTTTNSITGNESLDLSVSNGENQYLANTNNTFAKISFKVTSDNWVNGDSNDSVRFYLRDTISDDGGSEDDPSERVFGLIVRGDTGNLEVITDDAGDFTVPSSTQIDTFSDGTVYEIEMVADLTNNETTVFLDGVNKGTFSNFKTTNELKEVRWYNIISFEGGTRGLRVDDINTNAFTASARITDRFDAPTAPPADFQQWNAIQARDVTTGGSTSTEPVEFEILDSTDTALNSSRIPKARIADEPFTMRNRVFSVDAGSDGQSDYQIATTGDGGHFGIPVLAVVSVKKNGSVLNSDNWSFDGTDTVTIDTSAVTIASGDTIDIKYDFDVFDSTLQPRAYLSREDTSETSPSISHFRYEYVI